MEPSWTSNLGYARHDPAGRGSGNSRNGTSSKCLKGAHGEVGIEVPRDRAGTFEPQIVRKGQTRLTQMDDQILALYAKGMSTRNIVDAFREMYDTDVSPTLISKVTDRVLDTVIEWQTGCDLPDCLSGLYCIENPAEQPSHQQIDVPCTWHQ
ncbi:Transposase, Mutator family [Nitrosomonas eutropha]|uniref:Mutator family transposase n=1 Tax=Nitrosomonas eutropha TaxID=916 RepID=A0A1I7F4U4_9PROT|nr:Transposase, Mutator family [Nitrosomonas eutropha]